MIAKLTYWCGLFGSEHGSIQIRLLRLSGSVSLLLQPWLDVSFAHIACGFQSWYEKHHWLARTSPDKSRSWLELSCPLPPTPCYISFAKLVHRVNWTCEDHDYMYKTSSASKVMSDFAAFARWRGDSKLWKPLLTQFCFEEAHRNGSCNESKTDMLAGAATFCNTIHMCKNICK